MNTNNAVFSIIIPSYNSMNTIKYTIESIFKQNIELVKEIIIVDSSENEDVRVYAKSLKNNLIKTVKSGVRVMPAIQRNIGAKESIGNILIFLDSDVILHEGYIETVQCHYNEGKKIGGGAITLPEFQKNNSIAIAQYYLQLNEFIPCGIPRIKQCIPGCNIYCDRDLFFDAGCFPEIRASEDTQFCYRANDITDVWFIPEAQIAHIFREDKKSFYSNQELLGNYIGQNKKVKFSIISRTTLMFLFVPVILIIKLFLISSRLIKVHLGHMHELIKCFSLIVAGLFYWSIGFIKGYKFTAMNL